MRQPNQTNSVPLSKSARVIAALPTPCREAEVVDPAATAQLAHQVSSRGCDGLFALGSTGEMVLIDEDDRRKLTSEVRVQLGSSEQLYVGIGGFGARQATRYAVFAGRDGADVAVAMAPFFQILSQEELVSHFQQIADHSPIPIGIYHHLRMNSSLSVETIAQLSEHPNIVAYKDTSTEIHRIQELVRATAGSQLKIYQGSELLLQKSIEAGAYGCVSALATIAPEWHRDLVDAAVTENWAQTNPYQEQINRLVQMFRLREVGISLSHFIHTLKVGASRRGWLSSTAGLLTGFHPSAEFEDAIHRFLDETLLAELEVTGYSNRGSNNVNAVF